MRKGYFLLFTFYFLLFTFCTDFSTKKPKKEPIPKENVQESVKTNQEETNQKTIDKKWDIFEFKNDTISQKIKIVKVSRDKINFVFEKQRITDNEKQTLEGIAYLEGGNEDGINAWDDFYTARVMDNNCSFWIVINVEDNIANQISFGDDSNCLGTIPGSLFEKKSGGNFSDSEN